MSVGAKYFWLEGVTLSSHLPQKSFVTVGHVFCHHFCHHSVTKLAFFSHAFQFKYNRLTMERKVWYLFVGIHEVLWLKSISSAYLNLLLSKRSNWTGDWSHFPHHSAVSQCYFLSDPWALAYRWSSWPHLKPATIKMSPDRLSLFFLCRQASLNEAAEKYYGQAASLRPNVSIIATR